MFTWVENIDNYYITHINFSASKWSVQSVDIHHPRLVFTASLATEGWNITSTVKPAASTLLKFLEQWSLMFINPAAFEIRVIYTDLTIISKIQRASLRTWDFLGIRGIVSSSSIHCGDWFNLESATLLYEDIKTKKCGSHSIVPDLVLGYKCIRARKIAKERY